MPDSLRIGILGAGNLAWSLAPNLIRHDFVVETVVSRNPESARILAEANQIEHYSHQVEAFSQALDLIFVCVPDHEIGNAVHSLAQVDTGNWLVAHCSGSMPMSLLATFGERCGVMWPIQTLTRDRVADFTDIPLVIETGDSASEKLGMVAAALSRQVRKMDSVARARAHLGAVMVSNFANFMWVCGEKVLESAPEADFSLYAPLIREQVEKAIAFGPMRAQTGPARRGDEVTLDKHKNLLQSQPELQKLYSQLSQLIFNAYHPSE